MAVSSTWWLLIGVTLCRTESHCQFSWRIYWKHAEFTWSLGAVGACSFSWNPDKSRMVVAHIPFSISEITCFVDELPTFIFEILYNSRWWHHFSLFLPTISFFLYVCCLTSLLGVQFHFWLANNINVGFWLVQGPPLN